ncbi:hypothetical protein ACOSP7_022638 [Xanthoceras sorbifolium]
MSTSMEVTTSSPDSSSNFGIVIGRNPLNLRLSELGIKFSLSCKQRVLSYCSLTKDHFMYMSRETVLCNSSLLANSSTSLLPWQQQHQAWILPQLSVIVIGRDPLNLKLSEYGIKSWSQ